MTRVDIWYDLARKLIHILYDTGYERLAGLMLLDAVKDLYLGKEPEQTLAYQWFTEEDSAGLTLEIVCGTLGIKTQRVRYLVARLEAEPPPPELVKQFTEQTEDPRDDEFFDPPSHIATHWIKEQ